MFSLLPSELIRAARRVQEQRRARRGTFYTPPPLNDNSRLLEVAGMALGAFALVVAALLAAFYFLPMWLVGSEAVPQAAQRLKLQGDVRTAAVQLLGGLAVAAGAVFTFRNVSINRDYQITERYTRAIDQLGASDLSIRVGGIYGLGRIARESTRDHGPIMEVLCAFVRQHGQRTPGDIVVDEDVHAAVLVLGRREVKHDEETFLNIVVSGTNLRRADLRRTRFREARLGNCDLTGAWLGGSDFTGAAFSGAILTGAFLSTGVFAGASFGDADLTGAAMRRADLRGADLATARLTGVSLAQCLYNSSTKWPPGFDLAAALKRERSDQPNRDTILEAGPAISPEAPPEDSQEETEPEQ